MTIDTARCETCKGTRVVGNGGSMNHGEFVTLPCPDCTEPAPSAGVSQAEKLADAARSLCSVHGSDPVAYVAARLADVERYYGESQLREITLKKRIAELEKQCETLSRMHKQMCELAIERFERIAELEAVIYPSLHDCGACADIRALLPKESGPEREECEK